MTAAQLFSQQQIDSKKSVYSQVPSTPGGAPAPIAVPPAQAPSWVPWAVGAAVGGTVLYFLLR